MGRYTSSTLRSIGSSSFGAAPSTTTSSANNQIDRRPLVVEFGSTVIRAGHADQFQPQHLIPVPKPLFVSSGISNNKTESEWYITLSPIIELIYDRLMVKPSSRYIVCVTQSYLVPTAFVKALQQHLWNRNVPAMVMLNSLDVGPATSAVFGMSRSLMVQIHRNETVCGCYSDGYVLPFTYQSVPVGYEEMLSVSTSKAVEDTSNKQSNADNNDGDSNNLLGWMLIDCNNSNSILTAILLCLQECPLDARAHAVSNIFFSGEGVTLFPDIPQRVTKHLQQILRQPTNPSTSGGEETPSSSLASSSPSSSSLPPPPPPLSDQLLSIVPIDLKSLRSLESRIRLISCAPYRPDVVCWVGASLYATTWMKYDDEESPIPWIYQPRIK